MILAITPKECSSAARIEPSVALNQHTSTLDRSQDGGPVLGVRVKKKHKKTTAVLKFSLPASWLRRIWTFEMQRSYGRWDFTFCTYCVVPPDSPVMNYAREGNIMALQKLFESGQATPFSVDEYGSTLLHVCVRYLLEYCG